MPLYRRAGSSVHAPGRVLVLASPQARLREPADDPGSVTPTPQQVATLPITRQRTVVFCESADGKTFCIDGREYDPARDDVVVDLGDVEAWTLVNTSGEPHVFHIHQLDFLVTSVNGAAVPADVLRDVVDLPSRRGDAPGVVKVIIPFTNPIMVGRFVFHCHVVEHEDGGMMANLVVLPPGQSSMAPGRMRTLLAPERRSATDGLAWLNGRAPKAEAVFADAVCRSDDATRARRARSEAAGPGPAVLQLR
jgi:hypothetical protein